MSNVSAPIAAPTVKRPSLRERRPGRLSLVGHLDVERQRALRGRIAPVEDLRHDLVAEVEVIAGNARLMRGDEQPHELGARVGVPAGLPSSAMGYS